MAVVFNKVSDLFGWLGNMAPFPVTYEGLSWPTTEHLFQAMRFEDKSIRETIRNTTNPVIVKRIATKKEWEEMRTVEKQSDKDVENMRKCLRLKVEQHQELRGKLIHTTGTGAIIEDATARMKGSGLFWGMGQIGGKWEGENMLGKLWVELREEIGKAPPPILKMKK
ncbi:MAG TPA: NADAR family protein [Flavobacteriales bacterium]|nr:NADAR family protein [Flavobacteriales bacterium]